MQLLPHMLSHAASAVKPFLHAMSALHAVRAIVQFIVRHVAQLVHIPRHAPASPLASPPPLPSIAPSPPPPESLLAPSIALSGLPAPSMPAPSFTVPSPPPSLGLGLSLPPQATSVSAVKPRQKK